MKDLIKFYKINPTKIKVIHHGVKKKFFKKREKTSFSLLEIEETIRILIYY